MRKIILDSLRWNRLMPEPSITTSIMMPVYDHPTLWKGSSSIIDEISEQLPRSSGETQAVQPDLIMCSVGGGSLLGGLLLGCNRLGWDQSMCCRHHSYNSEAATLRKGGLHLATPQAILWQLRRQARIHCSILFYPRNPPPMPCLFLLG